MASSGDIRAGRAAVELYVDQSELQKGLKQAEHSIKNVDKNLGAMKAGMIANQFAVGLQDFATVYEQTQDFSRSLSAAMNNAIQLMSMINPMAGAITAAAIAGYQLYNAFSKTAQAAKEQAKYQKEAEESRKRMLNLGKELEDREFGPEGKRDLLDGVETRSDAREKIDDLQKRQRAAFRALRERDAITEELQTEALEKNDDVARGKYEASRDKGFALQNEIARIDEQIKALNESMGGLPFFSEGEMDGIGNVIADANRETEEANRRKEEEAQREYERSQEKRQSEVDSVTQQFETKAERRARLAAEYERLSTRGWFGGPAISDETYNRAMASLDQRSTSVVGTFSGAALGGLSGSSPLVAIQRATERTAKATEAMSKKKERTWS